MNVATRTKLMATKKPSKTIIIHMNIPPVQNHVMKKPFGM